MCVCHKCRTTSQTGDTQHALRKSWWPVKQQQPECCLVTQRQGSVTLQTHMPLHMYIQARLFLELGLQNVPPPPLFNKPALKMTVECYGIKNWSKRTLSVGAVQLCMKKTARLVFVFVCCCGGFFWLDDFDSCCWVFLEGGIRNTSLCTGGRIHS